MVATAWPPALLPFRTLGVACPIFVKCPHVVSLEAFEGVYVLRLGSLPTPVEMLESYKHASIARLLFLRSW